MVPRARTPSVMPLGLVGMIVLILGVERYVARHEDTDFTTVWAQDWRHGGLLARKTADCQVLCLGDSLVKLGVAPKLLERRLGTRAANLATCVGQPPGAYFLLKKALDHGSIPRLVVVDFTEHLLATGPRRNLRHWPEILDLADLFELASEARDPSLFAELATARILPSIKTRVEVRASILAALGSGKGLDVADLARFWRNWNENRGAELLPEIPARTPIDVWFRQAYPASWRCDPVNLAYIHKFLTLAADRRIVVVWLLPPYKAEFQAICESNGVDGRFASMVRSFRDRYPGLVIADGRKAVYPNRVYAGDPLHLNAEGATGFSDDVAEVLARVLAGRIGTDRWVSLPDFQPRPVDPLIEDLDQSADRIARRYKKTALIR